MALPDTWNELKGLTSQQRSAVLASYLGRNLRLVAAGFRPEGPRVGLRIFGHGDIPVAIVALTRLLGT